MGTGTGSGIGDPGSAGAEAGRSVAGPADPGSRIPDPDHGPLAISVQHLSRRFGAFVAVNDLSFDVRAGEIFGFLGSNGAGKSTTIRMLCGLLRPTSGTAMVDGIDVSKNPEGIKQRIGYMSQRFSLYELLTVDQNIRFFGGIYGLDSARLAERRQFVIEMAGLAGREDTVARDLAGGWRQRLALGCAILHEPRILFLDEPTGGVDPLSRRQFWRLIDTLSQQGVTVLVTTHYLDEAERCHRVALIHGGRLAVLGTTTEVKGIFKGRPIVEVRADDPVEAMRILDGAPGVEKTSLFGTTVHAVLRNDGVDLDELRTRLGSGGVAVEAIEPVVPSLEDVFLEVVDRAGGAVA
jgi:drug efflux transport system ATP-binding protein